MSVQGVSDFSSIDTSAKNHFYTEEKKESENEKKLTQQDSIRSLSARVLIDSSKVSIETKKATENQESVNLLKPISSKQKTSPRETKIKKVSSSITNPTIDKKAKQETPKTRVNKVVNKKIDINEIEDLNQIEKFIYTVNLKQKSGADFKTKGWEGATHDLTVIVKEKIPKFIKQEFKISFQKFIEVRNKLSENAEERKLINKELEDLKVDFLNDSKNATKKLIEAKLQDLNENKNQELQILREIDPKIPEPEYTQEKFKITEAKDINLYIGEIEADRKQTPKTRKLDKICTCLNISLNLIGIGHFYSDEKNVIKKEKTTEKIKDLSQKAERHFRNRISQLSEAYQYDEISKMIKDSLDSSHNKEACENFYKALSLEQEKKVSETEAQFTPNVTLEGIDLNSIFSKEKFEEKVRNKGMELQSSESEGNSKLLESIDKWVKEEEDLQKRLKEEAGKSLSNRSKT